MRQINLIFLGEFSYPHGMAGTKRIEHAIKGIRHLGDVVIRVIVLRQLSKDNILAGFNDGIGYETVMGDLTRGKVILSFLKFYLKSRHAVKRAYHSGYDNIIYNYGPPNLFNIGVLVYAKYLGYKIVFDIVEDYETATDISRSLLHFIKIAIIRFLSRRVKELASGFVVISSHLEKKYNEFTKGRTPVHFRPISVDFHRYPSTPSGLSNSPVIFYSGSFGKKDGVLHLLDAFDILASKHPLIRLVLTGKGSCEALRPVLARIEVSPNKSQIEYKGYMDDEAYYIELNAADIPCMTRIDFAYAHAGFPFKLGEFLATGKPVVASCVSDVEQLLEDRQDAMLVKPGDTASIVNAIDYLITHPLDAMAIGMRGREKARDHFDYREQGRALFTFLRGLENQ